MPDKTSKTGGKYSAVVIAPAIMWCADPTGAPPTWSPTPTSVLDDVDSLVRVGIAFWSGKGAEVTVVLRNIAVDLTALAEEMKRDGYKTLEGGIPHGWLTVYRTGSGIVHLGVMDNFDRDDQGALRDVSTIFLDADSKTICHRLGEFARLTGAAWRGKNAGLAGSELLHRHVGFQTPGTPKRIEWTWSRPPMTLRGGEVLRSSWASRPLTKDEQSMRYAHRFDVRLMFLNAMTNAEFGRGVPVHVKDVTAFSKDRPGYWQIDPRDVVAADKRVRAERGRGLVPMLSTLLGGSWKPRDKSMWVTTPIAALIEELTGEPLHVTDAWLSPDRSQVMRAWGTNLREAVREAERDPDPQIRTAIKEVANSFRGLMVKDTGRVQRRDWSEHIVDHARAMLLRRVVKSGYDPVRYVTDSIWVMTDDGPDVVATMLGAPMDATGAQKWQMGALRYEETVTPTEYMTRYKQEG